MPHKDPEARRAYMKARYHRIQAEDPVKWAAIQAKSRRSYEKQLAQGEQAKEKRAADYKRWYDKHGKENAQERKGYESWEVYQERLAEKRKSHRERMQKWTQTEAGQRARTERSIRKRCGLTIEQYDETYDAQEGNCKACGVHGERYGKGRLVVDHCHTSGHFRALLCGPCNSAIGLLGEDTERMRKVIALVDSWKAAE